MQHADLLPQNAVCVWSCANAPSYRHDGSTNHPAIHHSQWTYGQLEILEHMQVQTEDSGAGSSSEWMTDVGHAVHNNRPASVEFVGFRRGKDVWEWRMWGWDCPREANIAQNLWSRINYQAQRMQLVSLHQEELGLETEWVRRAKSVSVAFPYGNS